MSKLEEIQTALTGLADNQGKIGESLDTLKEQANELAQALAAAKTKAEELTTAYNQAKSDSDDQIRALQEQQANAESVTETYAQLGADTSASEALQGEIEELIKQQAAFSSELEQATGPTQGLANAITEAGLGAETADEQAGNLSANSEGQQRDIEQVSMTAAALQQ